MKRILPTLALSFAALVGAAHAQVAGAAGPLPSVPTTKILAIGHIVGTMTPEIRKSIMPHEVSDTVRLYLSGKIDQWYVRKDQNGVVFLINATTVEEARSLLEALPLGKAKLMEFDLIPLGPLSPLNVLLQMKPTDAAAK